MSNTISLTFISPGTGDEVKDVELISSHVMKTLKAAYGEDFPDMLAMQIKLTCCEIIVEIVDDPEVIQKIHFAREALNTVSQKRVTH